MDDIVVLLRLQFALQGLCIGKIGINVLNGKFFKMIDLAAFPHRRIYLVPAGHSGRDQVIAYETGSPGE